MTYILLARETAASRFWYVGIGCFDNPRNILGSFAPVGILVI
jgi:hypothetical protein